MKNLLIVIFLLASIAGFSQQQTINIGTSANDGTGDPLRTAFQKTNANFSELYVNVVGSGTASGTDTYTLTADPTAASYYDGQRFIVKFTNSNTGSATININSLGAKTLKKNVSSDLSAGDIQAGQIHIIQYDGTNFQVLSIVGGGVSLGTEGQIPVMNSTDDDFDYSSKFTWDDTDNNFIAGNGTIVSGTNNHNLGDNSSITGSWVFTSAESATIYGNNSISAGWTLEVGDGVNFGSGSGTATFGVDHKNYGRNSHISGIGGQIDNNNDLMGGFVHSFSGPSMDGLKPTGVEYVLATDGAFNVSQNTVSQTAGHGAMAPLSVILGGRDHNIPSSSPRSAIIGGDSIKARASDPDNVYVPYLNVTEISQDDTLTQVMVRNRDTDKIYWRNAGTLGSTITPAALSVTDDTNYDLTLSGSPTTALLQDVGITISHSGVFGVSRGGTGTGTQFTPGSILFAGSSGVYSQDNSNLFWDDANNRIGKGVTAPLSQLHFVGQSGANTAPIQFSTGTLESTARAGTQEYSTSAYFTNAAGVRFAPGGLIHQTFDDVNNSGTTATDMDTRTLRASTLGNNGESIVYSFGGTLNDATATYQFITSIGGTTIFDTGAITVTTATGSYSCDCRIVRTSTSTVRGKCVFSISTSDTTWQTIPYNVNVTGLTLAATNVLKYTVTAGGASGGTNDATHKEGSIYWYPLADD